MQDADAAWLSVHLAHPPSCLLARERKPRDVLTWLVSTRAVPHLDLVVAVVLRLLLNIKYILRRARACPVVRVGCWLGRWSKQGQGCW